MEVWAEMNNMTSLQTTLKNLQWRCSSLRRLLGRRAVDVPPSPPSPPVHVTMGVLAVLPEVQEDFHRQPVTSNVTLPQQDPA